MTEKCLNHFTTDDWRDHPQWRMHQRHFSQLGGVSFAAAESGTDGATVKNKCHHVLKVGEYHVGFSVGIL